MSRKSQRRQHKQSSKSGPVQVGSVLYQALQIIAREIAKRTAAEATTRPSKRS